MSINISAGLDGFPSDAEVRKKIKEYYDDRRSGPVDPESTAKGLERFFVEELKGKVWEEPTSNIIVVHNHDHTVSVSGKNFGCHISDDGYVA